MWEQSGGGRDHAGDQRARLAPLVDLGGDKLHELRDRAVRHEAELAGRDRALRVHLPRAPRLREGARSRARGTQPGASCAPEGSCGRGSAPTYAGTTSGTWTPRCRAHGGVSTGSRLVRAVCSLPAACGRAPHPPPRRAQQAGGGGSSTRRSAGRCRTGRSAAPAALPTRARQARAGDPWRR